MQVLFDYLREMFAFAMQRPGFVLLLGVLMLFVLGVIFFRRGTTRFAFAVVTVALILSWHVMIEPLW